MKIFDYFYLTLVRFQVNILKKNLDSAKMSVAFIVALSFGWLLVDLILAMGLLRRNLLADLIAYSKLYYFIIMGIMLIFIWLRYYRFIKYSDLEKWRDGLSSLKRVVLHTLFLIILIGAPVLYFITLRLYLYGYVFD